MRRRIASALLFVVGQALAAELPCPAQIGTVQHLPKPESGWELSTLPWPQRLNGIALFDGPPGEGAELKPELFGGKEPLRASWDLDRANPRGYWLQCRYDGTRLVLSRRIEPAPTRCEAYFNPSVRIGGGTEIRRFGCR
ncbi:STY0301 family protein [Niveibacterium sp. SC-1]|uniref:STY0301 family protein n=1 Tax=Niveibacterium sp. SC-1 TaxID=3135646 RepID=UPI00311D8B6D